MYTFCRTLLLLLVAAGLSSCGDDGDGADSPRTASEDGDQAGAPINDRGVCPLEVFAALVEPTGEGTKEVVDEVVAARDDAVAAEFVGEGDKEGDDGEKTQQFVLLDEQGDDIGMLSVALAPKGVYTGFLAFCRLPAGANEAFDRCSTMTARGEPVSNAELAEQVVENALDTFEAANAEFLDERELVTGELQQRHMLLDTNGEPVGKLHVAESPPRGYEGYVLRCAD
jgi:hypothetical protein